MAETHQEIVKVWIAPGCIVCDACETDCPEVFEVQEETCIIKPEAMKAEFTRALTPSIIVAAEGCPVEVIKFETIEVEGPEPWAGKETQKPAEATVGAGTGGGGGKAGVVIPAGPPDPKWAGLLGDSKISPRGRGPERRPVERRAKVPMEAIASALPRNAPPDAFAAAMVGAGYARPQVSVAERIRARGATLAGAAALTRRQFNAVVALAWLCIAAVGATAAAALQSFMVPKLTKEPPTTFRAGRPADFAAPGVYEQFKGTQNVWLVRLTNNQLVAVSTICTHLGCIPNWLPADQKFKCPCHGSGFTMVGMNFEGPAPRPLERHKIYLDGEFVMVDKSKKFRYELGQWVSEEAAISV